MEQVSKTDEWKYYQKAKEAVETEFKIVSYRVDFEITGYPKGRKVPDRFLKSDILRGLRLPTPDIMGWVWKERWEEKRKLVIVEFKVRPGFMDIFQTKGYEELFNSDYTYLVSLYSMYESSRKVLNWVREWSSILETKRGESYIILKFLHDMGEGKFALASLGPEGGVFPDKDY